MNCGNTRTNVHEGKKQRAEEDIGHGVLCIKLRNKGNGFLSVKRTPWSFPGHMAAPPHTTSPASPAARLGHGTKPLPAQREQKRYEQHSSSLSRPQARAKTSRRPGFNQG